MTLEQFAGLMVGLGYKAVKGSRSKVILENDNEHNPSLLTVEEIQLEGQASTNGVSKNETNEGEVLDLNEVFYTFSWAPKKVNKSKNYSQKRFKLKTKKGKLPAPGRRKECEPSSKNLGNKDKPIDPDNPFAKALMGFNQDN